MLRIMITTLFCLSFASPAFAAYWTSCEVEGGMAKGYVHTERSLSFSGRVNFDIYDADDDLIDSEWELAVVIVVGADTEFVEQTAAPARATRCTLDISDAVGVDPDDPNDPNQDDRYRTSCEVVGGKAKGYVHTTASLSFSGGVYFKIYDRNWRLVEEDWEMAVVVVVGRDTEFVEQTDAPADGVYCTLDISAAVGE